MRNYDKEIRQLTNDINRLSLAKNHKEAQLRLVLREQKESKKKSNSPILRDQARVIESKTKSNLPILRDQARGIIRIRELVKAASTGKFGRTEGTVVNFNKWVTFKDCTGVKYVRAPKNILVDKNRRE